MSSASNELETLLRGLQAAHDAASAQIAAFLDKLDGGTKPVETTPTPEPEFTGREPLGLTMSGDEVAVYVAKLIAEKKVGRRTVTAFCRERGITAIDNDTSEEALAGLLRDLAFEVHGDE